MSVARHSVDRAFLGELLASRKETLAVQAEQARTSAMGLGRVVDTALAVAAFQAVVDPAAPELKHALAIAGQAGAAMFALASQPKGAATLTLPLGDGTAQLATTGPDGSTHVHRWLSGYYAATCARDRAALDRLCATPVAVIRESPIGADDYEWPFVEGLQRLGQGHLDKPASDLLVSAIEGAAEENISVEDVDFVLHVATSNIELAYRVAKRDAAEFNRAMEKALGYHQKYFTTIAEEGAEVPAALLPLGPTAMACLAHDHALAIAIDSDYLPRALILT